MKAAVWLVGVLLVSTCCESARILIFLPTPAKGHSIVTHPLFEELASRGHQLTLVTSYPHTPPVPNLKEIDMSSKYPPLVSNFTFDQIREAMPIQLMSPVYMMNVEHFVCHQIYSDVAIKNLIKSDETFDLVITEIFTNDCFAPFAYKFQAPLVSVVTSFALPWMGDRVGLPDNPAYIPNYFVDVASEMNLYERVHNTLFYVYTKLLYYFYALPRTQSLAEEFFGPSIPHISEIVRNTSLILINSYFSIAHSRPLTPNVVEIGGIHIRNSSKTIPKDLQDILDRSSNGVLVVSFGSMVRMASLPPHIVQTFLKCFAKLRQAVIFKYEEDLAQVPANVFIRKWLPQRELTEHTNVKALFIHGGLASTTEAVYFGKPMIGVPFFSDQFLNIKTMSRMGAGIMLDLDSLTEEKLDFALSEILDNPMYTENAWRLSQQFRDRPMTPVQTAVFWIEYIIRHRGAPHLRPSSADLPLYRYLLVDVVAVILLVPLVLTYITYYVVSRSLKHRDTRYILLAPKKVN